MSDIIFEDWGLTEYSEALKRQKILFNEALENKLSNRKVCNRIILCEHPHVLTLGKHADQHNILFSEDRLSKKGVSLYQTDRGGDVTYHGPGQLVVYPILDLETFRIGLKQYIATLEGIIIELLKTKYDISSERLSGAAGIWLDTEKPEATRKICAIGVKSSRYVTMHGLALNVNTDLSYYSLINPCGFIDKGVTSIASELTNIPQDMNLCKEYFREISLKFFS
jgi:lipoyl(octanoyl) transferase